MNNLNIYCDGGARGNPGPGGCACIIEKDGKVIIKKSKFLGRCTNNIAEYSAVLLAFEWMSGYEGVENLDINFFLDSELVVNQLTGKYRVKNNNLKVIYLKIKLIENKLTNNILYNAIPREKNVLADFLVNKVIDENM